jgi:hypothetical protein
MAIMDILWPFGIFYDHLVYLLVIVIYFHVLVFFTKKNPATLELSARRKNMT